MATAVVRPGEEVWLSGPHGSKVYRGNGNFVVDGQVIKATTICVAQPNDRVLSGTLIHLKFEDSSGVSWAMTMTVGLKPTWTLNIHRRLGT